jgi:dipeptidase D
MSNYEIIQDLKPKRVWELFAELGNIPRPSYQEELVRIWLKEFAQKLGLDYKQDQIGNLVLYKSAQNSNSTKNLILQAHMDMVCQKDDDLEFNFDTDPIQFREENGHIYATKTTLGSDNGIGLCMILAILEDKQISHPNLQAMFTMCEEIGTIGAINLDHSLIDGDFMINLDSETNGIIWTSSAGSRDVDLELKFDRENLNQDHASYKISVKNLRGGHSGVNAHENRTNAIKLLANILHEFQNENDIYLNNITGGNARNAIPRDANVIFSTSKNNVKNILKLEKVIEKYRSNYQKVEPDMQIEILENTTTEKHFGLEESQKIIFLLNSIHSGVLQMSQEKSGLVQTSNNLGMVETKENSVLIVNMTRSNDNFELAQEVNLLQSQIEAVADGKIQVNSFEPNKQVADFKNGRLTFGSVSPGWKHDPNNPLIEIVENEFVKLFGHKPKVEAVHAGLECGIFKNYLPDCHIISFGPTIENAHSPKESVEIKTVEACFSLFSEVVKTLSNL